MKLSLIKVALATTLIAGLAGCGGNNDTNVTPTSTPLPAGAPLPTVPGGADPAPRAGAANSAAPSAPTAVNSAAGG